jgi:hypothetical protein
MAEAAKTNRSMTLSASEQIRTRYQDVVAEHGGSLLLLRFRGSLFYLVERHPTTAIPDVDCHKDLHRSVQKVCSAKKQGEQL